MTTRNVLEFAHDVAEAILAGSGIRLPDVRAHHVIAAASDSDDDRREAALRQALSLHFSEKSAAALLVLRPATSEAATFARAILTAATRMRGRALGVYPGDADPSWITKALFGRFFMYLVPVLTLDNDAAERQAPVH